MAKGRRNNRRGRGGGSQNTTNDSDANVSNIAHDGSGDVLSHKGFSTGAFGTSDIDGSGLQSEVLIERSEMNHHEEHNFRQEVRIPSRSRTSSIGDSNDGFLNPNDFTGGFGQNSHSSVRSRASVSNLEHRANRMSQLSIQTNQDEFVLVPGSGGHDGHASIRSMRSQVSRQSAKGAMSSRDDILTEGDETGGDDLREEDTRVRLGSRASQLSRRSAFGGEVEIPMGEEDNSGFRSRRQSENVHEEWDTQAAQARRSHTSLYSHKSNGWNEKETQPIRVPSHHASRASVHSRGGDGWDQTAANEGDEVEVPMAPLSRHASRISLMSHVSNVVDDGGFGDKREHVSRAPSHHASRMSVASHRSHVPEEGGYVDLSNTMQVHVPGSNAPSHHASRHSVYSSVSHGGTRPSLEREEEWGEEIVVGGAEGELYIPSRRPSAGPSRSASKNSVKYDDMHGGDEYDNNEQIFGGGGVSHASRHSLHTGHRSNAPSHHASKVSIHSHAGGDAGIVPFTTSRPQSVHASRASIYSHTTGDGARGSRAPSHHSSRASIHSHIYGEEDEQVNNGGSNQIFVPAEDDGVRSRTSTRSQLSCIACADDEETEEGMEENEKEKYGLPQLGDEIEVPHEAVDEWGENANEMREEETMQNAGYGETTDEWRENGNIEVHVPQMVENGGGKRSVYGSRTSMASHVAPAPSVGGRSHHASRMSMRSNMGGMDENEDRRHSLQQSAAVFGGSVAPIPAIRLSRASLNQASMDWNHNSMTILNGGREFADENQLRIPPHHASKMSLRSVRSDMIKDPIMQTALSKSSIHSHQSAPRERRFSSRSTQDVAEWGETVNDEDEDVFDDHGGYGDEYDGGMRRGESHRSIYSTRSSKAGEQTEENLLQARLNRSREPSLASLADRPYIPSKEGWKSSAYSVKSTNDEMQHRSRRSRSSSTNVAGTGVDLRDEVVIPLNNPAPKPRSRSVSIASRRSNDGVVFADQPELYSHPDERFGGDKSIEGIPFRRTNEHEKTPQPSSKRGSKVFRHNESEDELRALASSASASHTSVVENTPPPSAGFQTPKSRSSRESYPGTAELSMPSPSPFNQTQFQREEYEAHKERAARASSAGFIPLTPSEEKNEIATQTGDTIARAAGQRFALHYGATQSQQPHRGMPRAVTSIPASARSSSYSLAPAPPSSSPPHEEEAACLLHHHQPMGEEERRRRLQQEQQQQQNALYDHGDGGDMMNGDAAMRKASSHSSSRFAPLPSYDMRYVEQYEASRSMASTSKTTATTSTLSSSTLKSHSQYASGASSYIDHLRPVQPSPATTNIGTVNGVNGGGSRTAQSLEMTTANGGYYRQQQHEQTPFSPSKGTVAQKAAAIRQKEEAERGTAVNQEYNPVYKNYLARTVNRQVPIEITRGGDEIVIPIERREEQPKIVNVEIKRAPSSVTTRVAQNGGIVHIDRPKMNNSFERNNHPAAAVLNSMLSARVSPDSSRSDDPFPPTRQSSVGGTSQGGPYIPQYSTGYVPPAPVLPRPTGIMPTTPTSAGYQRPLRSMYSDDVTSKYEMKYDSNRQQMEERSKDEQSVFSRFGSNRADISPKGITQMEGGRQPMRSREAEKAYNSYHDKKSVGGPSVPITSVPKPFSALSPYRSAALGQQQQVYGAYRAKPISSAPIKKQPMRGGDMTTTPTEKEKKDTVVVAPIEPAKYTGETIRRAIPTRGHIRNLAAAFDTIQVNADREVTIIEPNNVSVQRRASGGRSGASTSSVTSSARGLSVPHSEGIQQNGRGGGQELPYRVPVHLERVQHTGTTTTSGSTRVMEEEEYEMMRRSGYNERSIQEWQTANEQQMRQQVDERMEEREERNEQQQRWTGREQEEEDLGLDSESDRQLSIHSGGRRTRGVLPVHVLRTSTPLAGVKNDPRALARALERIPSIRGDDTLGRGRAAVRTGGVRALASQFEKAAEEETEKARSTSMTPRVRRREEPRRMEGEDVEDRREAAARRLSRGIGGVERREEREKEKKRSQSAHVGVRKRRSSSTSDSGEESVMRDMEAVERMAREEILRKEREEMRVRKVGVKGGNKNEGRRPSEEERKIDEMFRGLESHESGGERGTAASSRDTMSGGESDRRDTMQSAQHPLHQEQQLLQHQHYQYQQKYREHHQHQHHHYQSHLQSVSHQSNGAHLHPISGQQQQQSNQQQQQPQHRPSSPSNYLASHLHPISANGGLEHGVMRRESTQTMHTTTQSSAGTTGLVYSPSVYRETGRAMRGDVTAPFNGQMQFPLEHGRGGMEMHTNVTTASSPHFSPVNIRGPETAGQRVATYESRDGRNPVRVPSRQVRPYALATSTPLGTVHSSAIGNTLMTDDGVVLPPDAVEDDSFLSTISGESRGSIMGVRSPANQAEYKKQIARLQTVQSVEEEKISITSKALAHARKKQNPHNELAAQRTILLARLRVAALKRELQRLSALAIVRNPPPPVNKSVLGAMDISDITLHLNRNLCAKPSDGGSVSFGFIVVLKCGVEVEATAPVCLLVPARPAGVKAVHFPEHLRFANLPVDFTIRLEVYVMKLREPKEESCTALLALKARSLLTPSPRRAAIAAAPGGSSGSGGSPAPINGELPVGELVRCGHTALDRDSVGSIRLYLDAPEYPLEGTIELASRCSRLPSSVEVDLRGFLTMYKVVGGYGSWVRYWAVLRRGVINFWKYPDDEQLDRGGPVASADLSKCTDGEIMSASREICTRQFAFSIDMLVATTPSIVEKKRVLLAADNREQLKAWLGSLNETLAAIRA